MSGRVNKLSSTFVRMAVPRGRQGAQGSPLAKLPLRVGELIRGSLRAKFIVVIVSLILALMGAVTLVVERHQRRAILEQTQLRALALGASLAAVSEGYLLSYDFIQLEQVAENVTANNADVMYAVAHLRDGKVAAFSRRGDLQGKRLDDPVSQRALQTTAPLVQDIIIPDSGEPGYDVAIPVYGHRSSQKWGTVRVGFSLQRAYALIQQTRRDLVWLSLAAMGCGTLLAAALAMRISKPIGQLVAAVHAFARGAYDRPIRTGASDEIGYLAHAFEQMRESLQGYLTSLKQHEAALERKVDETRTLYEIGQEITAQVALEPTLHLIVERARELSQAESSLLALRQGASDTFAFQAYSGTVPEALARVDFGSGEESNGCAMLTASPITVNADLREYPASPFLEAITKMGVRSVVAVPLKARGMVIGVLTVTSQAAHQFHEEDQQLLSALADQAAIAIENAQLFEAARTQATQLAEANATLRSEIAEHKQTAEALAVHTQRLEAVRQVTSELTRELHLPTLLNLIIQRAVTLIEATGSGSIHLWDEETQVLRTGAWYRMGKEWIQDLQIRLGEGVVGTVAQQRQGLMVDDYQQSPYANRALVEHAGSRAVIAEPLLYRERLIGVLIVGPGTPGHRFTAADRDLLALLAAQATIAIENARLFEDSTRRQAWLTTILDINKRIATNEDMASLLAQIAEEAVRFIGADGTILRLLRGDQLVAMGATPYGPTLADVPETRLGEGIVGRAALENRVFMVPDVQACPDISPYRKRRAAEFGINSMVCIPVCDRHHVLGVLSITSKQPRVFTADETMVISAYAEQCAIAIEHARLLAAQATIAMENAKLYEQVRQYAGDLEAQVAVRTRELQETNQQLAAASRHKSAFLANVSHELRTPLTAVKGSVDNMLDGLTGAVNDKQRRYLTRIQANTDRLARLIHDLLDLARIEAGKSDLQPASLPVVALTHEVVEYLGPMAAEKHICLEVAAADASVTAWADREKVTQVLMNLMGNALKFTPAHGTVVIAIHRSDDAWVQIAVTDTGPGIPAAEATHIFEQFYQIATAGRQKTTGTGLGLAIAKSLVEMQGGQLWVESAVGRGSTFAFTLPCSTH